MTSKKKKIDKEKSTKKTKHFNPEYVYKEKLRLAALKKEHDQFKNMDKMMNIFTNIIINNKK